MHQKPQPSLLPSFLLDALAENRTVHLCVDNQAYYPSRDLKGDKLIEGIKFQKHIVNVTNALSPYIPTIHINYAISDERFNEFANHPYFSKHQRHAFYDEKSLRAYPTEQGDDAEFIELDFVNPAFTTDFCYIKHHCNAFNSGRLNEFLTEKGWNVPLFSGAYLTVCITESLDECLAIGRYKPVILDDCVMDYDNDACAVANMRAYHQDLTRSAAAKIGVPCVQSADLFNHLKIDR
jgi:nicotinamidase-related amidase